MSHTNTPMSLYLHIPFCTVKCTYCAFNTYINLEGLVEPFTNALIRELEYLAHSKPGLPIHTIFLGGGTPSLLSAEQIGRILDAIKRQFTLVSDTEVTMEANPDDIHVEYVQAVMEKGINRLSLGMQSAHNHELNLFGRRHDADTVYRAVSAARRAGMDNLNLDLIFGVPHQTIKAWEISIRQALALHPDHVSLYALGIEEGTAMSNWIDKGKLPLPEDDLTADMYDLADEVLAGQGYSQYEISNWSVPNKRCRHNEQYWLNQPYPGLGPGAHGYVNGIRYETVLSPHRYIKLLTELDGPTLTFPLTPAVHSWSRLDRETEIAETLLMGLRLTQEGILRNEFKARFGTDVMDARGKALQPFIDSGLLHLNSERLILTHEGRFLSNLIFRELV